MAGILSFMSNEFKLNVHSHDYSQALHLAEAGVEIGFGELNYQYFRGGNGFQDSRGWTSLGGGAYQKTISGLTDTAGNEVGNASVTVSGVGSANPQILGVGTCTEGGSSVSRAVTIFTSSSSKFPVGIMSKQNINLNGNNIYSDSFDSSDSLKSTSGQYDPAKKQANGDVATNSGLVDSLNVGNADIYGKSYTGSGGSVSMGPNGSIGPTFDNLLRADTVAKAESSGWVRHDFNVDVPDVALPSGAGSWVTLGNINNNATITGGDWRASGISLSGSKTVTIVGTVRLYVTGNASTSGNGSIVLAPGAKLEVYVAGSISLSGNGVINSGRPQDNQWNGLPTCTSASISGNGRFDGTLYVPQAFLSVSGNGAISGALVASSLTFSGDANIHYDEALRSSSGGSAGYVVAFWQSVRYDHGSWVPE
jgi:hypothetical protein